MKDSQIVYSFSGRFFSCRHELVTPPLELYSVFSFAKTSFILQKR